MLIYQKTIDRSALRQGFTIPVEYYPQLMAMPGGMPKYGETRNIKIVVEGESYDAQLKNQAFNLERFEGHTDVIQVRYGENSPLAKKLREVYRSSCEYVVRTKALPENVNRKVTIKIPEELQEFLALSATEQPNVFVADCISLSQRTEAKQEASQLDELEFETFEPRIDATSGYVVSDTMRKIRHLDRTIGDYLKGMYNYRCQVTGEKIGDQYGESVIEAHHIVPFTQSMNNDSSNIIIISPNFHRIIHKNNPHFNRQLLCFEFENGVVEKVKLDRHLGVG